MSLTGVVGGLGRAIPIAVITLVTQSHLGSCPVGIAYTKRVGTSRPRFVADDCDYLLRGTLAHHASGRPSMISSACGAKCVPVRIISSVPLL